MTAVVVVHGLWMPGGETYLLRERLLVEGFTPAQFRYRTISDDLSKSAARLAEFVASIAGDRVHLVGHSLGGLVILKMLELYAPLRFGRIVCLGSPLCGSAAGENLRRLPGGRWLLGKAMAQVIAEAPGRRWDGSLELGIIAGDLGVGLGRVLGRLPVPHDGTVAVVETQLPGASDHLVLPVSHFAMLFSAAVAWQTAAFLRTGHFKKQKK
jgi:pimeloyl-ACP methyl ester carboxylesterase